MVHKNVEVRDILRFKISVLRPVLNVDIAMSSLGPIKATTTKVLKNND